jgi:polyphosphate kinase 2 (PPK2 family)
MLERTDTKHSPWHVIAADSKKSARIAVMDAVIGEIERGCVHYGFTLPAAAS